MTVCETAAVEVVTDVMEVPVGADVVAGVVEVAVTGDVVAGAAEVLAAGEFVADWLVEQEMNNNAITIVIIEAVRIALRMVALTFPLL